MSIEKFTSLTFCLLLLIGVSACVQVPKTIEFDNSLSYTEIDGYKFHTEIFGSPELEPIIVVHGGPGGDYEYLKSLTGLSQKYRIIFYDQRGSGLSPRVDKKYLTVAQNLNDLRAIVKKFSGDAPVRLIGHSWGGMLVTAYLSAYPEEVSQAVIIEPGMLDVEAAKVFVERMKDSQSLSDMLALIGYISMYPLVNKDDGHEGFDYVMTKILNRNKTGGPYQCTGHAMPENSFKRGGYETFNEMLRPIMDDPNLFTYDLTKGSANYAGEIMFISSECSLFGYEFQKKYHIPKLPAQTVHVKAEKMGHNMITLNPEWSLKILNNFFH